MYEISIRRTRRVKQLCLPVWTTVSHDAAGASVYGYTPQVEQELEEKAEIFTQKVDNLDLVAVIKAINIIK